MFAEDLLNRWLSERMKGWRLFPRQKKLTRHCPRAAVLMTPCLGVLSTTFLSKVLYTFRSIRPHSIFLKYLVLFWECGPHILLRPQGHRRYQDVPALVTVTVKPWDTVAALPGPLLVNLHSPCSAFSQARIIRGWPGMSWNMKSSWQRAPTRPSRRLSSRGPMCPTCRPEPPTRGCVRPWVPR